jgi:hypothetical protein
MMTMMMMATTKAALKWRHQYALQHTGSFHSSINIPQHNIRSISPK